MGGQLQPIHCIYLMLAVPSFTFDGILSEPLGQLLIRKEQLKLIIFEETKERIRKWIS